MRVGSINWKNKQVYTIFRLLVMIPSGWRRCHTVTVWACVSWYIFSRIFLFFGTFWLKPRSLVKATVDFWYTVIDTVSRRWHLIMVGLQNWLELQFFFSFHFLNSKCEDSSIGWWCFSVFCMILDEDWNSLVVNK